MENQPKLEDMLLNIYNLTNLSQGAENIRSPQERINFYENIARMHSEDGVPSDEDMKMLTTNGLEYALIELNHSIETQANVIKHSYEENKKNIKEFIETNINKILKSKNKAEASIIIAQYLNDILIKGDNITQDEADQLRIKNLRSRGYRYTSQETGSPSHYKELELRKKASEYLKGDGKNGYSINSEKLDEAMKDVVVGAKLYGKITAIKQGMEKTKG